MVLFWDRITGLVELPISIQYVGWILLEKNLPFDAETMKDRAFLENVNYFSTNAAV